MGLTLKRTRGALLIVMALAISACTTPGATPARTTEAIAASSVVPADNFVNARAIIIVRHADIDVATKARLGNATPLLPRGQDRAKELITALKSAGVSRIITSSALRTKDTAAPLAETLHLVPEETPNPGNTIIAGGSALDSESAKLIRYLSQTAKPTDTILLVHHHSVIPSIMAEFGFHDEPEIIDATEFDRLYVILPDATHKTYQLLRLRYGGRWE